MNRPRSRTNSSEWKLILSIAAALTLFSILHSVRMSPLPYEGTHERTIAAEQATWSGNGDDGFDH